MSRPKPDLPEDHDDDLWTRLISGAGDPKVVPRPEHVASLRTRLLDQLGSPVAAPRRKFPRLAVSGLAAACLLILLVRPRGNPDDPTTRPGLDASSPRVRSSGPSSEPPGVASLLDRRRGLEGTESPTFNWPLRETVSVMVSSRIPPDLLD